MANSREREFLKQQEFLLDLYPENEKIINSTLMSVPVRFPNGNMIMFPSDMFLIFETESLKDAYPSFLS
jgi:hypothetical protein